MTIEDFLEEDAETQRYIVTRAGIMIAQAEKQGYFTFLFQVHGFYVEFYFHPANTALSRLEVFDGIDRLDPYIEQIDVQAAFV